MLKNKSILRAPYIIYSGTVWNLYGKLIENTYTNIKKRKWASNQIPTYPSVVLYAVVNKDVIPNDTAPIEMLIGSLDKLDEAEVTVYILSIDDKTLCPNDKHVVIAICPSFGVWDYSDQKVHQERKKQEKTRLINILE